MFSEPCTRILKLNKNHSVLRLGLQHRCCAFRLCLKHRSLIEPFLIGTLTQTERFLICLLLSFWFCIHFQIYVFHEDINNTDTLLNFDALALSLHYFYLYLTIHFIDVPLMQLFHFYIHFIISISTLIQYSLLLRVLCSICQHN